MDKCRARSHHRSNIAGETIVSLRVKIEDVESELFFDTTRDHYQLMPVGWHGLSRVYHTVLNFDIKDRKIRLQQQTADIDVGQ